MNVEPILAKAEVLIDQNNFRNAEVLLLQALSFDPDNVGILCRLAHCKICDNKSKEALEILKQVLALNPQNDYAYFLSGIAYYNSVELFKAGGDLLKAISLNPTEADYYGVLALVYLRQDYWELALEKAEEGLKLDPDNFNCLSAKTSALNMTGSKNDFSGTMNYLLSIHPDNKFAHYTLGMSLLREGRNKQAVSQFRESLRLDPKYEPALVALKIALQSNNIFYNWLMRFTFSIKRRGFPPGLYLTNFFFFSMLIGFAIYRNSLHGAVWSLMGLFFFFPFLFFLIKCIADFSVLFYRTGRLLSGKSGIIQSAVSMFFLLMGIFIISGYYNNKFDGTVLGYNAVFTGVVAVILSIYVSKFQVTGFSSFKSIERMSLINMALGLICLIFSIFSSTFFYILFAVFALLFFTELIIKMGKYENT